MTSRLREIIETNAAVRRAERERILAAQVTEMKAVAPAPRPTARLASLDEHLGDARRDMRVLINRSLNEGVTHAEIDAIEERIRSLARGFSPIRRASILSDMNRDLGGVRWRVEERIREETGEAGRVVLP